MRNCPAAKAPGAGSQRCRTTRVSGRPRSPAWPRCWVPVCGFDRQLRGVEVRTAEVVDGSSSAGQALTFATRELTARLTGCCP